MLLAKVVQLARLREIELKQALVEIALLELVAQLQDRKLRVVALVKLNRHLVESPLEVALSLRNFDKGRSNGLVSLALWNRHEFRGWKDLL